MIKIMQSFTVQATFDREGLHITIPRNISGKLSEAIKPRPEPIPMYGVVSGRTLQISCERFNLALPALSLSPDEFIPQPAPIAPAPPITPPAVPSPVRTPAQTITEEDMDMVFHTPIVHRASPIRRTAQTPEDISGLDLGG